MRNICPGKIWTSYLVVGRIMHVRSTMPTTDFKHKIQCGTYCRPDLTHGQSTCSAGCAQGVAYIYYCFHRITEWNNLLNKATNNNNYCFCYCSWCPKVKFAKLEHISKAHIPVTPVVKKGHTRTWSRRTYLALNAFLAFVHTTFSSYKSMPLQSQCEDHQILETAPDISFFFSFWPRATI